METRLILKYPDIISKFTYHLGHLENEELLITI